MTQGGATAALQETESPPKRVRRKQSLKHTGDEAKDTAIQAVESVSAFGDAGAPTGSPQTLFNTHPRDLVDRYRKYALSLCQLLMLMLAMQASAGLDWLGQAAQVGSVSTAVAEWRSSSCLSGWKKY